ncbi:hypothetical protein N7499_002616 [Penicillium canescens]|uniref:Uncharacterized protein n=1 Tax=Penicillium canescens TaxID=5083 RepID=A0AAD6I862_PENCN|nr:uncharacterized protein N7446_010226 [Penicillium canescens]KAJ6001472.1 hypothetical protein N7522_006699 [Penicillium canescens]KAJ6035464.1 hypothetical protein N7460_009639 [Penicillium canescens]KAJ6037587.1 hypothetical protein N7444_010292 [Penicillium canescens]KAJ6054214.1 hypothetical protein N7446_010226 [Penicillium canescens]KAJ6098242.1 hypothetical protein N7499_002616 [Penicillium canescens]
MPQLSQYLNFLLALSLTPPVLSAPSTPMLPLPGLHNLFTPLDDSPMPPIQPQKDELGLFYGKCYRLENNKKQKLGYQQGAYYRYDADDNRRPFRVCRSTRGSCKREQDDQNVYKNDRFYLWDGHGSAWSKGPTWIGFTGVFLYPNIYRDIENYIAPFKAHQSCDRSDSLRVNNDDLDEQKDKCLLCVNLKNSYNNYNGLATYPTGYVYQTANPSDCVYWVFKEVDCPDDDYMVEDEDEL